MSPLNVLVVDDEPDMRFMLRMYLQTFGAGVREAGDGLEALQELREGGAPDAVLLDLGMPRMNGIEAIPRIRSIAPKTRILVFTVYSSETLLEQALKLGADMILSKATPVKEIVDVLDRLCRPAESA